ncbi:hypothetical protein [Secundilactobacillus mixtipabuli]|uniref:Uncharacterized protein n=1 Tax=Secundilactobacillus pentosiphilus TaxID=1714682 RepID=A0A1Z5IWL7_9LACO|nr:hypothetical protein [Secundilactobacillus mixtipabuli]GAX06076.1 hypothetical protein IWT25_01401 [Secundilactobacillus pentosiphilus]
MKPSKVFLKPFDSWSNALDILGGIGIVLLILDWYFPSFWLTSVLVLDGFVETIGIIVLIILNEKKKRRLRRHEKQ